MAAEFKTGAIPYHTHQELQSLFVSSKYNNSFSRSCFAIIRLTIFLSTHAKLELMRFVVKKIEWLVIHGADNRYTTLRT